jgi:hypothetical protein
MPQTPTFIPNSNTVVFSSNRTTDTTNTVQKEINKIPSNYNLFAYNLDTTTTVVTRITNTISKDYYPKALDENNIYYLSDQRGILNLFRYNRAMGVYAQITNFPSSIKEYDIDFGSNTLAVVMTKNLQEDIFVLPHFNLERQIFTPTTRRKEAQQVKILTEKRKKEARQGVSIKQLINERLQQKKDTVKKQPVEVPVVKPAPDTTKVVKKSGDVLNTDDYSFEEEKAPAVVEPIKKDTLITPKKETRNLNTDDYKFEDEVTKTNKPVESFLTRYMKARESSRINGPFDYLPKFNYDNFATNFVVDPLRGWSMRLETQMNDMLENYRIIGGIQMALQDLRSGDVYGEFQYLKHRIDYSFRFDRKVIIWDQNDQKTKYTWQKIEVGAALPLSVRTRLAVKPFLGYTRDVDLGAIQAVAPGGRHAEGGLRQDRRRSRHAHDAD